MFYIEQNEQQTNTVKSFYCKYTRSIALTCDNLPLLQKQAYDVDRCLLLPGAWLSFLAIAASGRFLELDEIKTN